MVANSMRMATRMVRWPRSVFVLAAVLLSTVPLPLRAEEAPAAPPTSSPPSAGPADELDRGVPRTAVLGFLKATRDGDYQRAAEYLDLSRLRPKERTAQGLLLARHLKVVFDHALWIDPEALSDNPEGDTHDDLPKNRDRIGTIHTPKEPVNVIIERVPRADGVPVWEISSMTVAKIPALYQEFGYGPLGDLLPTLLFEISFLGVELWQWIGLVVLVVVAVLAAWGISALIAQLVRPLAVRLRGGMDHELDQLIVGPLRLGLAVAVFYSGSFLLAPSLPVQQFFSGVTKSLVIIALTWLTLRVIDMAAMRGEQRLIARGRGNAVAVLPLGRRAAKVLLVAVATLAFLQNLGFNVTGLLAGFGLGGLAVALAAQETVKNIFGGITLIVDQPVRVGDFCRFGATMGTVEDISLWSTRVRTLEQTVVSIPNAQFAGMQLENLTRRDRIPLRTTFGLDYHTAPDRLRAALSELRAMLTAHPKVHHDTARVRVVGFDGPSLQVEVFANIQTSSFNEFLAVREEIFIQIIDVVRTVAGQTATP